MTLPTANAPGKLKLSIYSQHAKLLCTQAHFCLNTVGYYYSPVEPRLYDTIEDFNANVKSQLGDIFNAHEIGYDVPFEMDMTLEEITEYVLPSKEPAEC